MKYGKDVVSEKASENAIEVNDGFFEWESSHEPILRDFNLEIPKGILVAVVGQIGSGKSSLISALLGDMDKVSGHVNIQGKVQLLKH